MRTIILSIAVFIFASCGKKKETVFYDLPFEETMALAGQEGKDVYIIISRPGCPPCEAYMNEVNNKHNKDVILNFVDVMHPDNQWYAHWLCSGAFPTTCVFTSEGDLQAVVSGSTKSAMDCVEFSRSGETLCADYFYEARYPYTGDYKEMLGKLLECRQAINRGEDVGESLDEILETTDYPYPTYLKALNEEKHGRHDEAVRHAERLFTYNNTYYDYVYNDLYRQARYIINPDYMANGDGVLSMEDEIILGDCKVGEPRRVAIRVENTGNYTSNIRDIQLSCTCLELLSPTQHKLNPGESIDVELEFTGETKGSVYREVIFFSDTSEAVKRVALRAQVI